MSSPCVGDDGGLLSCPGCQNVFLLYIRMYVATLAVPRYKSLECRGGYCVKSHLQMLGMCMYYVARDNEPTKAILYVPVITLPVVRNICRYIFSAPCC